MTWAPVPYESQQAAELVDLINCAYQQWRSLPRVVARKEEVPLLTVAHWERKLREGDLNAEGIFSIWSAGKRVSVADSRGLLRRDSGPQEMCAGRVRKPYAQPRCQETGKRLQWLLRAGLRSVLCSDWLADTIFAPIKWR